MLPIPPIVDLPWVRCVFQQNFPRLPHFFAAYLDEVLLDRPCAVQASTPLLTILPLVMGSQVLLTTATPALLDTCGELVKRAGYQATFFAATSTPHRGRRPPSTTTTTGVRCQVPADPPFGALVDPLTNIHHNPLRVFAASSYTRYVSCTIDGNVVLEDLLSFVTMQLGEVHETFSGDKYGLMPRVYFSPEGDPTLFLTVTNSGSPTMVWVDARPFLPQPVILVVYPPIMISHICALLKRPDLRAHFWSWNGIVWEHYLVHMKRGDVITVRPHRSALYTAPINLLRLRVFGVQVSLFELTGPSSSHAAAAGRTAIALRTEQIRAHWAAICAATEPLFGDRREFSPVLLLGFGLPPIRFSARTRLPPTEQQLQASYDLHLAPIFGQREWIDTGHIDGEHCIFIDASSQGHRQRPWLLTLGYGYEAYLSDDQGSGLAHAPTPEGTRIRPVWFSTHFGRATMCDAATPDSPLHRAEHTDPAEIIVARPDLLQLAAPDFLAIPDDADTQRSIDMLHVELMQLDRDRERRQTAPVNSPLSAADGEIGSSSTDDSDNRQDTAVDDDVALMQHHAAHTSASSTARSSTDPRPDSQDTLAQQATLCHPKAQPTLISVNRWHR